jgi:ATP-binding cassette subfamily G (WHITE) protein 1
MYVITPLLFQIIVYFGVGLTVTVAKFFYFYLVMFLLVLASSAVGYFCSSLFVKAEDAVSISPTIVMPMVLFGGLFTNVDTYPSWITWL